MWRTHSCAMSLSFVHLSERGGSTAAPLEPRVRAVFEAFGESALGSHVEHSKKFLVVLFWSRSSNQFGPGVVDHSENVSEAELAWVNAAAASRHAHHRAHEIVGGNRKQ